MKRKNILEDLKKKLSKGLYVKSSGTTGESKNIFRTPENLKHCNKTAIDSQKITKNSRIYTVCKMEHAGGMLAQTLPAISIGADIVIEEFNVKRFIKEIHKYTHTHITPRQAKIIINSKNFNEMDLSNIWITCGSDCVDWESIKAFVRRGATFMANWGMSEIGPCAINIIFSNEDSINDYISLAPNNLPIMGENFYCDYQISDLNELIVKGDICIYDDWFFTGDLVIKKIKISSYDESPVIYFLRRN
ncbi:AMP-binding protein [Methylophilaceae bacterium]|nr:AMP-binding protein [Methylophilaceae bacterium]